ncbi:hypothetical protein [Fodinicola feengrottensis]|uniref:hypothetical protein n=1 Tax=Fodinicola feengrottensis TaxID=435914 RepID=UPI0036F2FFDA
MGAPLARLEGQLAFDTLLRRSSEISLAVEPKELQWRISPLMRGLHALPIQLSSIAPAELAATA